MEARPTMIRVRSATEADAASIVAFNCAMAAETERRQLDQAAVSTAVTQVLRDASLGRYFVAEETAASSAGDERLNVTAGETPALPRPETPVLPEPPARPVGQLLITYEISDWRNGVFWWIQSVYVAPEARGGGVYRALHGHVATAAKKAGNVCGLRLYVDHDNTGAQRVYERMGMRRTEYLLYEDDWSGVAARTGD